MAEPFDAFARARDVAARAQASGSRRVWRVAAGGACQDAPTVYLPGCNLACTHCWAGPGRADPRGQGSLMTHAQVRREVARYRRQNRLGASTTWTRLSGGEPILDEGFFDLLEVLLGLPGRVYVETNGTMLGARPAWLARLVAQGSRVRLNISLKAGRPDQYSRITGAAPAAWEATFACLSGLVAAGVDFDLNALTLAEALFTAGQRRALAEHLAAIHPDLPARLAQERLTPYPQTTRRMADAATSGPG